MRMGKVTLGWLRSNEIGQGLKGFSIGEMRPAVVLQVY